jgi:hypothetical protein
MLNINRRYFQAHPFHLVSPSHSPIYIPGYKNIICDLVKCIIDSFRYNKSIYLGVLVIPHDGVKSTGIVGSPTIPVGLIVFITVLIAIIGFIVLCSTYNQNNNYTTYSGTDNRPHNCRHSIIDRKQLQGIVDYSAYQNKTCKHGFKAMDHYEDRTGSVCLKCRAIFCGNPGCNCTKQ